MITILLSILSEISWISIGQERPTQVGPQISLFPIIWAILRKNGQNTDFPLNSESSLDRTKMFLDASSIVYSFSSDPEGE
jgi:hypothetical protein